MASITYYADTYASSQAITDVGLGFDITQTFKYVTGAAFTFAATDTLRLAKLPRGAIILDWFLFIPDIDSSTTLKFDLGLSGNANLDNTGAVLAAAAPAAFILESTGGQAGCIVSPQIQLALNGTTPVAPTGLVAGALPYAYLAADQDFMLTAHAAEGATGAGAGGTLKGYVKYHMHYPAAAF